MRKEDCLCSPGFHGSALDFCQPCSARTYKTAPGSDSCTSCPVNSVSFTASRSIQECLCDLGFSGPNGQLCTACIAGKYKDMTGPSVCISFKQFSVSQERSKSEDECYCNVGYSCNVDEDVPNTNSDIARQKTGVGGWRIVRFMPSRGNSNRWYKMCDTFSGTITVGNAFNFTADWTIPFGDFDQLLLGTYNLAYWMHLPITSTRGTSGYGNNARYVFSTSFNPNPHDCSIKISDDTPGLGRPFYDIRGGATYYGQIIYRESDK